MIVIELWFPRTKRSKSFYPWDNQEYFNPFDYEGLETYAILPEKIAHDINSHLKNIEQYSNDVDVWDLIDLPVKLPFLQNEEE